MRLARITFLRDWFYAIVHRYEYSPSLAAECLLSAGDHATVE
jgi:hypothetical protein